MRAPSCQSGVEGVRAVWKSVIIPTLPAVPKDEPPIARTKFGGVVTDGQQGSGFFRVEHKEGRWWFIDPEGGLFITMGVNCVRPHGETGKLSPDRRDQFLVPEGDKLRKGWMEEWLLQTSSLLKDNGFNTVGCWSPVPKMRAAGVRMPYTAMDFATPEEKKGGKQFSGGLLKCIAVDLGIKSEGGPGAMRYTGPIMPVFPSRI